jgi:hypothetical protein
LFGNGGAGITFPELWTEECFNGTGGASLNGGGISSVGRAGKERFDLIVISVASEYEEVIEYELDGTLETDSFGGVGGASLAGTTGAEFPLNDRKDTFELYPLSAFASGFAARSLGSLTVCLACVSSA